MNDGSGAIWISLRQADGDFFPVFRRGDPDTRNLSLVPASEGQDKVDIQFFHHASEDSKPQRIGTLRFPDLPGEEDPDELHLDAVIGSTGLLTITLRHRESGRVERLEMELPDDDAYSRLDIPRGKGWRDGPLKWIFGILFVAAGLALVFWLTLKVTEWGREDALETPRSQLVSDSESQLV